MNLLQWWRKERSVRKTQSLARRGKFEEALQVIESSLEKIPKDNDLQMQKCWLLLEARKNSEARGLIETLLQEHPNNGVLHLLLGEVHLSESRFEAARDALLRALELSGENLRVEYSLGVAYVGLKDYGRATQLFESIVKYDRTLVESRLLVMAEALLQERQTPSGHSA